MNKKYMIIFCLICVVGSSINISIGMEIKEIDRCDNFSIELNQSVNLVLYEYDNSDPYVEILSPENGTNLPTNYLEVVGYAADPDGMSQWQFVYECVDGISTKIENLSSGTYYSFHIEFFNIPLGKQKVTVTFYDIYDNTGSDSVTVYYRLNNPPDQPNLPQGPNTGSVGIGYIYSTNSSDLDGDEIKYGWDWDGDNTVDEWTDFYPSGQTIQITHIWSLPGTYNVKVKAEDEKGAKSSFSSPLTVVITDNHAPDKPEKPKGYTTGIVGVSYTYSTFTEDSDADKIYYMFDWDDGTYSGWVGPYVSGDNVSASHIWNNKGTYSVKVKAKDDPNGDSNLSDGIESIFSDSLAITMPKTYAFNPILQLVMKLIKHFPLFEKMLNQ